MGEVRLEPSGYAPPTHIPPRYCQTSGIKDADRELRTAVRPTRSSREAPAGSIFGSGNSVRLQLPLNWDWRLTCRLVYHYVVGWEIDRKVSNDVRNVRCSLWLRRCTVVSFKPYCIPRSMGQVVTSGQRAGTLRKGKAFYIEGQRTPRAQELQGHHVLETEDGGEPVAVRRETSGEGLGPTLNSFSGRQNPSHSTLQTPRHTFHRCWMSMHEPRRIVYEVHPIPLIRVLGHFGPMDHRHDQ